MRILVMERGCRTLPRIVSPYARQRLLRPIRNYASVTDLSRLPQPGSRHHGYTLQQTKHVPELELSALLFSHDKTGAEHLHIARDDPNNVFCIGFKTNPPDATGVPHILEHVTLCGSEKYPVRDPFFKMLPRSLNNFMNAFTTTDHTMYPIATTNKKDYRNLVSMYLDSTLHPLLKKSDFLQEGWRVGPENPQENSKLEDLLFKGVVYNEMKGQFSDATYLYYMRWLQDIYPSLNFYGGDPQHIPELTWEQLRAFHQKNYHPSNSKILTYGDTAVEEHLALIGPELDRFARSSPDTDLKLPRGIASDSQDVNVTGPLDAMLPPDAQARTSLTWLMGDTNNVHDTFGLRVATTLLLDGYGSPIYRALIESGLGTDYTPNTGLDTSAAKGIFAIGLNGVSDANLGQIKPIVLKTVQKCVDEGFDEQKIDGLLHQLELGLKHKTAGFGLGLINRLISPWFNGVAPFDALEWNSIVQTFKERHQQGGYLQSLLKTYLLDQPCSTFTMKPETSYAAELASSEMQRLKSKIDLEVNAQGGRDAAVQHLREQESDLVQEQTSGQDQSLDCLPTLRVDDIPRRQPEIKLDKSSPNSGAKLFSRIAHTNGLTYVRAIVPMQFTDDVRPLLPLFTDCLSRLGTPSKPIGELEDLIKLKTGGLSFSYHATPSAQDPQQAEEGLLISSYALDDNLSDLLDLVTIQLTETDFTTPTAQSMIKQLLQSSASGAIDGVAESGHMYARQHAEASLSPHAAMSEQISGLRQVGTIAQLASIEPDTEAMSNLVAGLVTLQQNITSALKASSTRLALTCGRESHEKQRSELERFLDKLSIVPAKLHSSSSGLDLATSPPEVGNTLFDLPFQVYYSGLALRAFGYEDPRSAHMAVLAQLLTHKHLHFEVREKGGAYGAGAMSRGVKGMFSMYSYRDPNPENTISTMQRAGQWAVNRTFSTQEMEEAKLSLFQGIDAPRSISDEGIIEFTTGIDHGSEQRRRELLLDVTQEQVKDAAVWLNEKLRASEYNLVVLGQKRDLFTGEWKHRQLIKS